MGWNSFAYCAAVTAEKAAETEAREEEITKSESDRPADVARCHRIELVGFRFRNLLLKRFGFRGLCHRIRLELVDLVDGISCLLAPFCILESFALIVKHNQ